MTRRSLASPAALLVAPTALLAACSRTSTSEPDTAVTRPAASPPAESALVRSRRVTAIACSPLLRQDALAHGTGAFCAPFDSIPAVRHPRFLTAREAELPTAEPVVAPELAGAARAYPVRYLVYHEVVNDVVDGQPVVVTFCPLCNSAAAHSRRLGSRTLTFGVSGQLEYANLVMFDRQTLSRWQQITGQATGGSLEGRRLAPLPVQLVSFEEWRAEHPSGSSCAHRRPRGTATGSTRTQTTIATRPSRAPCSAPRRIRRDRPWIPASRPSGGWSEWRRGTERWHSPPLPAAGGRSSRPRGSAPSARRLLPLREGAGRAGRAARERTEGLVGDGLVGAARRPAAPFPDGGGPLRRDGNGLRLRLLRPRALRLARRAKARGGPAGERVLVRLVALPPRHDSGRPVLGGPEADPVGGADVRRAGLRHHEAQLGARARRRASGQDRRPRPLGPADGRVRSAGPVRARRSREAAALAQVERPRTGGEREREAIVEDASRRHVRPILGVRPVDRGAAGERVLPRTDLLRARGVPKREDEPLLAPSSALSPRARSPSRRRESRDRRTTKRRRAGRRPQRESLRRQAVTWALLPFFVARAAGG